MECTMYDYIFELDETSPRANQPEKIKLKLNNHQLACIYKAKMMEQKGDFIFKKNKRNQNHCIHLADEIKINSNIGILGDIVGYGKTLTALGLIASSDISTIKKKNNIIQDLNSHRNYSYIQYEVENKYINSKTIIKSTLVLVPRGPVYIQWQKSLESFTTLKYLAIDNLMTIKKQLPELKNDNEQEIIEFFNQYDVVLIKNTTFDILISYYANSEYDIHLLPFIKRWSRVFIDEAHDICHRVPLLYYEYLWLISGTYKKIFENIRGAHNIKEVLTYENINLISVKCTKDFVKNSFSIPEPIENYYKCKMPAQFNAIRQLINENILDKINANDIAGAIKDLGGKSETNDNVIELVSQDIKREIQNKEREREYILSIDIPDDVKANKIKSIDNDIKIKKDKLQDLTNRISELNGKMCSICMYEMENPIVLECTHTYCATCIIKWLEKNMNCPECRSSIDTNKMIAIVNKETFENQVLETNKIMSKEDTLLKIIKNSPEGKFLIFSKYDNGFINIATTLKKHNIKSSELKGNTQHMLNVLDKFKIGEIKVILLNTNFAGSGIDISCATDVILYHSMGLEKYQAIGRAQRVGRTDILNIHYLCYEHEM